MSSTTTTPLSEISEAVISLASCDNDVFLGSKEDDLMLAVSSSGGVVHVGPWGGASGASMAPLVVNSGGIVVPGNTSTFELTASNVYVPMGQAGHETHVDVRSCIAILMGIVAPPSFSTSSLSLSNTITTSVADPTYYVDGISYPRRALTALSRHSTEYDNLASMGLYASNLSYWKVANTGGVSFTISSGPVGNVTFQVPTSTAFSNSNACMLRSNLQGTLTVSCCNLVLCPTLSSDPLLTIAYEIDTTLYPTPEWSPSTISAPPTLTLSGVAVGSNVTAEIPLTTLTTFPSESPGNMGYSMMSNASSMLSSVGLSVSLTVPPNAPALVISGVRTAPTQIVRSAFLTLSNALDPTGFATSSISPPFVVTL